MIVLQLCVLLVLWTPQVELKLFGGETKMVIQVTATCRKSYFNFKAILYTDLENL